MLWISRDSLCGESEDYELWRKKPPSFDGEVYGPEQPLTDFCPEDFEKFTNIKLKPGELRKIKSIKIELE